MNEYDIEMAQDRYADHPVLSAASQTLANLAQWADENSDGWAFWPKPARAAARLMELIERDGTWQAQENNDPTAIEYKRAISSIKAFRTRMGASFKIIEVEADVSV